MNLKIIAPLLVLLAIASCDKEPRKILVIGDSISIGYTPHLIELLDNKALITHNPGNAQHTGTGMEHIAEWIGEEDWDLIQFNWGLWDLAYRHPDSKIQGQRDKVHGRVTFSAEEYGRNLDSLVRSMKMLTQAPLVFATTTYVPEGEAGRFVEDGPKYNSVAREVMKKYKIPVTDLYDFSQEIHPEYGTAPDNVHYTALGYRQIAKKVIQGWAKVDRYLSKVSDPGKLIAHPTGKGGGLSIQEAVEEARIIRKSQPNLPIQIVLEPGDHYLRNSLTIDPILHGLELYGSSEGMVRVKGAQRLNCNWVREGKLLKAHLPQLEQADQLFVDSRKQILARYPNFDENGGHWQGHAPDAIDPDRIRQWAHPEGAYVHAMHGSEWGDFHFVITGVNDLGEAILAGGHQNNRPSRMHQTYRMVENVKEELDAPGEFYFDKNEHILYWYPDQEEVPEISILEIPILQELIRITGVEGKPVRDVLIRGIHFCQSDRSFMEDYEPLLRSDWTIYRGGALFISGAENCIISDCEFSQLGGNGIFASGYNRHIRIERNHLHEIGASGIAFVGLPSAVRSPSFRYNDFVPWEQLDTVPGPQSADYPAECRVDNNLIYRVGRIEKQVAGIQVSMSMDITISRNSIYDLPRAGINISEGTWGGHLIEYNDVFLTVQESGDHGSFNSWGRDRFWHPNWRIMDSMNLDKPEMPLWDAIHTTVIRNNRFRCDHGWDIDLDDGSSNYWIYNNLCLNGGLKLREGFHRKVENNVIINNGFHPHVWFSNSGDIFRRNILMTDHKDIRLAAWGEEVDYNLFPNEDALMKARNQGTDQNSSFGNPEFRAPELGDYRVLESSPALALGFTNFPMDSFGVQEPKLKGLRREPEIPELFISEFQKEKPLSRNWLGAKIKNIETLAERSASGLSDESGVLLLAIEPGGLSEKAGLKVGDVIVGCEGVPVRTWDDLLQSQQGNNWKGKLGLRVFRDQKELELVVKTK